MNQSKAMGVGLLAMRIIVGAIMMYYGSQKLFGLFGGAGFTGTIQGMQERNGIPPIFATLAMFGEFCGGLSLLLGLLIRVGAFGMMCTMAVATFTKLRAPGFGDSLLNGEGPVVSGAFFPLTLCAVAFGIMLIGGGAYSLDAKLMKGRRKVPA